MKFLTQLSLVLSSLILTSCSFIPSSGPLVKDINNEEKDQFNIINVDTSIATKLASIKYNNTFANLFSSKNAFQIKTLAPGDTIEVRLWEAPPAVLFGGGMQGIATGASAIGSVFFPEQAVNRNGKINIPFAGMLNVNGKTTDEVEKMIVRRLTKKANEPQAMVRLIKNNATSVSVIGEVSRSTKMPLTPKSRILDALIASGWVKHPVDKISIQLTRHNKTHTLPLENIIENPEQQNIGLESGDIITALYQPFSFTALGANSKNEEINFETKGITLAQALARSGGLVSNRSDVKGIFIFRFEDANVVRKISTEPLVSNDKIIPVIYQIDFGNPQSLFAAQRMPIENKDFIYIAEAPSVELKRFLDIISSTIFSALNIIRVTQ